jgi:hypothetical protein
LENAAAALKCRRTRRTDESPQTFLNDCGRFGMIRFRKAKPVTKSSAMSSAIAPQAALRRDLAA